jgi:hypothetical protein
MSGPRILITGKGTSGSWKIRGEQLGRAIGATVVAQASRAVIEAHDLVVLVKRGPEDLVRRIHESGKPLVWDVVDAWPQPAGSQWPRPACLQWLRQRLNELRPAACVAATRGMERDIQAERVSALCVWHHARPGLQVNPIREQMRMVGYEGSEAHLGVWRQHVDAACRELGLQFLLQPHQLADVDVVVALREANGYAAMQWKSNVKLANAQGSGTPAIVGMERSYADTNRRGYAAAVASPQDLVQSLRDLAPKWERARLGAAMRDDAPGLGACAAAYLDFLTSVAAQQAGRR